MTREWWEQRLGDYDAYVSEIVIVEASAGDHVYAKKRLESVQNLIALEINPEIQSFATLLLNSTSLPIKAERDAQHIALAAYYDIQYLITWNCTHIANAHIRKEIGRKCVELGYNLPVICTPLELLGEKYHVD